MSQNKKGFTIIETSLVLAVLGLILAAALVPYSLWHKNQQTRTTEVNVSVATAAITNFLIQRGRYPCPARLNANRTDADYGLEGVCDNSDPSYPATTTAGTFAGGFYYERGRNTVNIEQDLGLPPINIVPVIRRGSLPFRSLGLGEDQVEDGYGMRLQYAITENLAVNLTYIKESGAIRVRDGNSNSLVSPPDSAHYVIFSTGKDNGGGFSRDGIRVLSCIAGHKDTENCNTEFNSSTEWADYVSSSYSIANDSNYYDDFLKFYSSVETPLWRVADSLGLHIRDLVSAESGGRIGIGVSTPAATLDVAGQIRADGGVSMVGELCDVGNSDCVDVGKFGDSAGNVDYQCASGVAFGISGSRPGGAIDCKTVETNCPSGQRLLGIQSDGSLNCGVFNGCATTNIVLCGGTTFTLPTTNRWSWPNLTSIGGTSSGWTPVVGSSYRERWQCRSGSWSRRATTGICLCIPDSNTSQVQCNDERSGNWIGTIDLTTTTVCPSGNTTTVETAVNCTCVPISVSGTASCPSGPAWSGTRTTQNDWTCSSALSGSWSGEYVVLPDNYCSCDPTTKQTQDFSCQANYKPNPIGIRKERTYDCVGQTWGSWSAPIIDDCICDTSAPPDERTTICTLPLSGTITERANWDCSLNAGAGGYGPWYEYTNNCGAVTYKYVAKTPPKAASGSLPVSLGQACLVSEVGTQTPCSTPTTGSGFNHFDVCQCE